MTSRWPAFLDLSDRRVVVVGGGPVAARKVWDLLDAGAHVHVVAPALCEDLREEVAVGSIRWIARDYATGDLAEAWLAVTATGSAETDAAVRAEGEADRVWVLDAGAAEHSRVWGAMVQRAEDGVVVAVSGGGDPRRARAVHQAVGRVMSDGDLPLRRQRSGQGRVFLVGGGPGHPDLLTVRGSRLLALADVVVIDRLAPWAALDGLASDVEVIDVGKAPGHHAMGQEEINSLLVQRAHEGKIVVRLKGGDPFVLGRGGEEALACVEAGVPVEVVPGVTSAVAVPAAAGIPLTHRGVATSFVVVSAHSAASAVTQAVSAPLDATLVLLMGVGSLRAVAAGLVAAGRSPRTPVAIVEQGWTPQQRTTGGTLADIADRADSVGVGAPAVVVVGDVVEVGQRISGLIPELVGVVA